MASFLLRTPDAAICLICAPLINDICTCRPEQDSGHSTVLQSGQEVRICLYLIALPLK